MLILILQQLLQCLAPCNLHQPGPSPSSTLALVAAGHLRYPLCRVSLRRAQTQTVRSSACQRRTQQECKNPVIVVVVVIIIQGKEDKKVSGASAQGQVGTSWLKSGSLLCPSPPPGFAFALRPLPVHDMRTNKGMLIAETDHVPLSVVEGGGVMGRRMVPSPPQECDPL
eukprot:747676-Hanusia_phi.AAC.1